MDGAVRRSAPRRKHESGERQVTSLVVLSSSETRSKSVAAILANSGYRLSAARSLEELVTNQSLPNVVLVLLPLEGADASLLIGRIGSRVPVVFVGVDEVVACAEDALRVGAAGYARDPAVDPRSFLADVASATESVNSRQRPAGAVDWSQLLGASPAMERVRATARQICLRSQSGATPTVLVTGETGTGKGLLAKCIHFHGGRGDGPFVDVNCAAIPESLIEAELFGHERGAFTDAREARVGLVEAADGGTLFLDEVAALPLDLQAKLLTVIDEKRVRRIGARHATQVDVQLIAATHRDLRRMVESGTFRADLFHRLNVVWIRLPALRDRGNDRLLIAQRFLDSLCREIGIPPRQFAEDARERILSHSWPGNVRELKNKLERILMLEDADIVEARHFDGDGPPSIRVTYEAGDVRVRLPPQGVQLDRLECEIIREALAFNESNVTRTARYLGISRQTLMYRMKKHGLERTRLGGNEND